jgi:RimJ/RimL family protein N-acetyltransferase
MPKPGGFCMQTFSIFIYKSAAMDNGHWVPHPTTLHGQIVDLLPLEPAHLEELLAAASDKRIWEFYPGDWSVPDKFLKICLGTMNLRKKGMEYPFVVVEKSSGRIIGSTRLMDIVPYDRRLEIGGTWLMPAYWATAVNFDCKLALLTFSFETMDANRVQLKTQHNNLRSRKAIEKIGGVYEGVIRQHILKDDGSFRSSAYFSILKEEWEEKKERLQQKLADKLKVTAVQDDPAKVS